MNSWAVKSSDLRSEHFGLRSEAGRSWILGREKFRPEVGAFQPQVGGRSELDSFQSSQVVLFRPQVGLFRPGRPGGREEATLAPPLPNGPKWIQSAPKCTFPLLGPKMQKGAHFALLEPKVRKSAYFRILARKSLKFDAETICFISICGQGAKRTPKCIFGPQNAFWSPKCVFGPQNAFWAPKCSLAKRGQSDYTLFRTAVVKTDVSKM